MWYTYTLGDAADTLARSRKRKRGSEQNKSKKLWQRPLGPLLRARTRRRTVRESLRDGIGSGKGGGGGGIGCGLEIS